MSNPDSLRAVGTFLSERTIIYNLYISLETSMYRKLLKMTNCQPRQGPPIIVPPKSGKTRLMTLRAICGRSGA